MKGTVGIVDFHAATNYGSALLAYALQRIWDMIAASSITSRKSR